MDSISIREAAALWLKDKGYDGLWCDEPCFCTLDDLMPCSEPDNFLVCEPGKKVVGCTDECGQGCDYHLVPDI